MIRSGQRFAGYELQERLGESGMGVLYKARDVTLQRSVALRIIPPELSGDALTRARLNRESTLLASLNHPNVAPIFEAGVYEGSMFIATQWVEGVNLNTLVRQEGPLQPRRAGRLANQIASALQAAHEHGVMHRDVKPSNVQVTATDHAYLTNFGVARRTTDISGLTRQDQLLETFDCVAPEYIQGTEVDRRVDIYGLGCVLYQALTGEVPYPRPGPAAKMYAHLSADPPSARARNPEVPEQLDAVVKRALAKDPAERQQTPAEFALETTGALEMSAPPWTRRKSTAASPTQLDENRGRESSPAERAAAGARAEPVRAQAEPVRAQAEPVRAQGEAVAARAEPVRARAEAVAARAEALAARAEPVRARSEPVADEPADMASPDDLAQPGEGAQLPDFSEWHVYRSRRPLLVARSALWMLAVLVFIAAPVALLLALHNS
jgi:serine/threonine protein kinase